MFTKKINDQALKELRDDITLWTQRAEDAKSPQIKRMVELLDAKREETIEGFITKDPNAFDSDEKWIMFSLSTRSILQTIKGLKSVYASAESKRRELADELARLFPE